MGDQGTACRQALTCPVLFNQLVGNPSLLAVPHHLHLTPAASELEHLESVEGRPHEKHGLAARTQVGGRSVLRGASQ